MAWTADDLITAVRRKARLPDDVNGSNASLTDEDILSLANEATDSLVVPFIRQHREEYYVVREDFQVEPDRQEYRIPSRAQGQALRDVVLLNSGGDEVSIPYVPLEDVGTYRESKSPWWNAGSAFSIRGNQIILVPTPSDPNITLRLKYHIRPGRLVKTTQADRVDAAPINGTTLTLTTGPNVTWAPGQEIDIIHGDSPFEYIQTATVSSLVGNTLTLSDPLDFAIPNQAYIAAKEESPVPQMPSEVHTLLITLTTAKCFDALGHFEGAAAMYAEGDREIKGLSELIEPRVIGEHPVVLNWNSPLRFGRRRWR